MSTLYTPETISQHPYVAEPDLAYPASLVAGFNQLRRVEELVLEAHEEQPIDLIVGDDVSGRVPTLITHSVFRLAKAAGHIDTVPRFSFLAAGYPPIGHSPDESLWDENLRQHVRVLLGKISAENVLIMTDQICWGRSINRIRHAFMANSVDPNYIPAQMPTLDELQKLYPKTRDRVVVGVEKSLPKPITHLHPAYNREEAAALRHFLHDYSGALYRSIF